MHFAPVKYRILGGILQSINIQSGNFLETAVKNIIGLVPANEIVICYSGRKDNKFKLSQKTCTIIDEYIMQCQTQHYTDEQQKERYNELLYKIVQCENEEQNELCTFKQDIDLLFFQKDMERYR